MLDIEKLQKQHATRHLSEIVKDYDRDFVKVPSKDSVPQNPPFAPSQGDLFARALAEKKEQKKN